MQWRLGIDLGTNSLGWAALCLERGHPTGLLDMGVRIFSDGREPAGEGRTGDPLNDARRLARQMRRQRDRKIRRKRALYRYLANAGYLPKDEGSHAEYMGMDPYRLRSEALSRKLQSSELTRVLMQLVTRRGFKSNRKEQLAEKDDEAAGMLAGIDTLRDKLQGKTLGQWLYERMRNDEHIRFRPRFVKSKTIYDFYPSRDMYEDEFDRIRKAQERHHPEMNWDRLHWIIFFQRPLKRPEKGRCQFYPDELRAYRALPSAHRFRMLQDIHNLLYYGEGNVLVPLTDEEKDKLYELLESQKKVSFDKMRQVFHLPEHATFNLEDAKRKDLKGDELSCDFRKAEYFGSVWDALPWEEQDAIVDALIQVEDVDELKTMLVAYSLSEEQARNIVGYNLPTGTAMLSSKFMVACARVMKEQRLPYHEATVTMGLHHSYKEKRDLRRTLPYYGAILVSDVAHAKGAEAEGNDIERFGYIANPTVHIGLNQLRKLLNALIRRFGRPSEIIIEIGRDLKTGPKRKAEIFQEQTKNQEYNEAARNQLKAIGLVQPTGDDIKKYRLWDELAPDGLARRCPYCGKNISAKQLLLSDIEIEHILPYSRTLLDSRDNLTVAHRECNRVKKEHTPFEAFGDSPPGFDWNLITKLSEGLPRSKRLKFTPGAMERFDEKNGGFIQRQINDNAYLAKAAKNYLAAICDRDSIWVTPGRLTAFLRGSWGINTLLNKSHDTWFKNRSDHRHHALDATVIGLCDRHTVSEAARVNASKGYHKLVAPECPIPRADIEKRLGDIVVSHKLDHGKEGKLYKETALGKRSILETIKPAELVAEDIIRVVPLRIREHIERETAAQGFKTAMKEIATRYTYLRVFRDRWVTTAPLESLSERDLENVCDPALRAAIVEHLATHSEGKLQDRLAYFGRERGVRSVRYFPKDQVPFPIASCPNKAYMPGDYYRVDVWAVPRKGKEPTYEGVFISRVEAFAADKAAPGGSPIRKPHPAAKLIMSLHKGDIIRLLKDQRSTLAIVQSYSTTQNKIDIRPLYAATSIQDWAKDTNVQLVDPDWPQGCANQNFKSINVVFKDYDVATITVSADGRVTSR